MIHCRQCKWWKAYDKPCYGELIGNFTMPMTMCVLNPIWEQVREDHYCSHGIEEEDIAISPSMFKLGVMLAGNEATE
jgi:hypothetical protein